MHFYRTRIHWITVWLRASRSTIDMVILFNAAATVKLQRTKRSRCTRLPLFPIWPWNLWAEMFSVNSKTHFSPVVRHPLLVDDAAVSRHNEWITLQMHAWASRWHPTVVTTCLCKTMGFLQPSPKQLWARASGRQPLNYLGSIIADNPH